MEKAWEEAGLQEIARNLNSIDDPKLQNSEFMKYINAVSGQAPANPLEDWVADYPKFFQGILGWVGDLCCPWLRCVGYSEIVIVYRVESFPIFLSPSCCPPFDRRAVQGDGQLGCFTKVKIRIECLVT